MMSRIVGSVPTPTDIAPDNNFPRAGDFINHAATASRQAALMKGEVSSDVKTALARGFFGVNMTKENKEK